MIKQLQRFKFAIVSMTLLSPLAQSHATTTAVNDTVDSEWKVLISPFVWGFSMKGNTSLAGIDTSVDLPFSKSIRNLDSVFMANVEVARGDFGIFADGVYVRASQTERQFGQKIDLSTKAGTIAFGVRYNVFSVPLGGVNAFGEDRTFTVAPLIGIRHTRLSASLGSGALGLSVKKKANWTDPFIGVRLSADFTDRWNIVGQFDIGGFDTSSKDSYNAQMFLGYRTQFFKQDIILRAGYRILSQRYETDDFTGRRFKYDVTQRGPALGLTMSF